VPVDLVWTPQAREDLIEIYSYIGLDNPSAAERIFDAVQAKAELLVEYPRIGVRRPDIRPSTRMLIEGPYLIPARPIPIAMKTASTK
jgi:toxin ParE1/3/4